MKNEEGQIARNNVIAVMRGEFNFDSKNSKQNTVI